MKKTSVMLAGLLAALFFATQAHAQVEIFGGYSYLRPAVNERTTILCPGPPCPVTTTTTHPNLNGWEASGTYNMFKVLGLTADFGGNYGNVQGAKLHANTYLFGPQIRLPGPVSPFAHVLIGEAHETIAGGGTGAQVVIASSDNAFATAAGGGIDIKAIPFVSLRLIQLDYLVTRFGSGTQHQPRASVGFVIHF